MELWEIATGQYRVLTVTESVQSETISPTLRSLRSAPANLSGSAKGMISLFKRYATDGPGGLTTLIFHLAGDDDIYEFIRGDFRVYCFKDDGNLVILSHCALKRGKKTSKSDLTTANAAKTRYIAAKTAAKIVIKKVLLP